MLGTAPSSNNYKKMIKIKVEDIEAQLNDNIYD